MTQVDDNLSRQLDEMSEAAALTAATDALELAAIIAPMGDDGGEVGFYWWPCP